MIDGAPSQNPYASKGLNPDELVPIICHRMSQGELQEDIAADLGFTRGMVWRWTAGPGHKPEHARMYARARELQAHALAEEAMRCSRNASPDNAHAVRVHVDTIKWYTSKLAPKLYGERIQHTHSIDVTRLSDEELELLAAGKPLKLLPGNEIDPAL